MELKNGDILYLDFDGDLDVKESSSIIIKIIEIYYKHIYYNNYDDCNQIAFVKIIYSPKYWKIWKSGDEYYFDLDLLEKYGRIIKDESELVAYII